MALKQPSRVLWPYLALAVLATTAAIPLLRDGFPCTDDLSFHLYRAVELGSLINLGHFFPRWSPHMALGYGYPFYDFYAPLSSYGLVLLNFAGLAYPTALKLAFILVIWLAGCGAYLFVSEIWGIPAGLAAGAAYVFAPYLAYDILFRGNLAEAAAFIWPPLVLWGLLRVGSKATEGYKGEAGALLVVALALAALVLTHNIFALITAPLFVGYTLLLAYQNRSRRVLAWAALALFLGTGLSAYFWVPALLERGLVHSDRLFVAPIFTWYTNFISVRDLLALPSVEDPLLMNPSPPRAVGLLTVLLALPSLAAALFTIAPKRSARPTPNTLIPHTTTLFFGVALLGYGLLTLAVSAAVWRLIPPLALVQFPWRMLGPAALCAAVLVGASVAAIDHGLALRRASPWASTALVIGVVAVLYVGNLPWWYPRYCGSPGDPTVAGMIEFELASNTIGTTAKGEYLPLTARGVPDDRSLADALQLGNEPPRLKLPAGATMTGLSTADPLDASYRVNAEEALIAIYQQFYFPGWSVSIDGKAVSARPDPATGMIAFDVPAGGHQVQLTFGLTPIRAVAAGISYLCVAVLAARGWIKLKPVYPPTFGWSAGRAGWAVIAACTLLPLLRVGVIDRFPNPLRRTAFDPIPIAPAAGASLGQHPLPLEIEGGLRLFGYDLSPARLPADDAFDVALYLARTQPGERRLWPVFFIEDQAGLAWQDPEYLPPRWQREPPATPLWPVGQYAQWARHISLAPGTPPGTYTLWGQVFDLDSRGIASVLDPAGNALSPRFEVSTLSVERPARPWRLVPPTAAAHDFGPLSLLGFGVNRVAVNAGDTLLLTLYWRSETAASRDFAARVRLTGADGAAPFEIDIEPANGYPTSQWRPGDAWRGQARLRVPATLAAGDYEISVTLPGLNPGQAPLTHIHVGAPPHAYEPLPAAVVVDAEFAGVGALTGYTLTRTPEALLLNLAWRATATADESYNIFVHLQEDATGRIWAQSDTGPADWTRPTTGWLPGEFIADRHRLALPADLPAGTYTLWAGLYEPRSGARVAVSGPAAAPDQRVALGTVQFP